MSTPNVAGAAAARTAAMEKVQEVLDMYVTISIPDAVITAHGHIARLAIHPLHWSLISEFLVSSKDAEASGPISTNRQMTSRGK